MIAQLWYPSLTHASLESETFASMTKIVYLSVSAVESSEILRLAMSFF